MRGGAAITHWDRNFVGINLRVENVERVKNRLAVFGFLKIMPNVFKRDKNICVFKEDNYVAVTMQKEDLVMIYRLLSK